MAALFLLALALIVWQALRTKPVGQPAFEVATQAGERLSPVAVPSWRPPLEPPREVSKRLTFLDERSLSWPGMEKVARDPGCRVFVRLSSQHWVVRSVAPTRIQRWLGREMPAESWQLSYLPVESFLDDDDGDGDPIDDGELMRTGPGSEVEVFCDAAARSSGGSL